MGGLNEIMPDAMPDIRITLSCSLKDFYCGARKKVTYQRQIVDLDGRTLRQETTTEEIFVRPGMKRGTEFHLKGKGNEMARRAPTDLYVKIERPENSDIAFQRINEFDLVYVH